ncbi:MAG: hypothetical protein FJY85_12835, partial [Deltaproteobacteria bacterium]|nr:hypothetical protein [Deltaproteobacteria bacterium]
MGDRSSSLSKARGGHIFLLRTLTMPFLCAYLLCALPPVAAGPRMELDVANLNKTRVCSRSYRIKIPIVSVGDEPLSISRIRLSCPGCTKTAIDRNTIEPGACAQLLVWGNCGAAANCRLVLFLETNDERESESIVELRFEYSPDYRLSTPFHKFVLAYATVFSCLSQDASLSRVKFHA